jgi:hypothetical protein
MMDKDKATSFKTFGSQDAAGVCGPDGCNITAHRELTKQDKKTEEKQHD